MKINLKRKENDESSGDDFETPLTGHKSQSTSKGKREIEEKSEYALGGFGKCGVVLESEQAEDEFEVNFQKDSKDDFEKEDSKQKSIEVATHVGVEETMTDQGLQTPGVIIESQGFLDDVGKSFDNWKKGNSYEKSLIPSFDLCITQEFEMEDSEKEDLKTVENSEADELMKSKNRKKAIVESASHRRGK
ncbi:hypothetical protein L1887_25065 [Cichorium endivia]|nr:hypothetical protein L1887_25065 [Cichorium endivia]